MLKLPLGFLLMLIVKYEINYTGSTIKYKYKRAVIIKFEKSFSLQYSQIKKRFQSRVYARGDYKTLC